MMKAFYKRAVCLLLMLALCAGLLPSFILSASAVSLEEKQRAVILTAFAYYEKGFAAQYDSVDLSVVPKDKGGAIRSTHSVAPEYATPDETMFSVCSDFCYQVYYNTFGYKLCGSAIGCYTARLSKFDPQKDTICAYRYNSQTSSVKREQAITDFLAVLQPGDVLNAVSTIGSGGHAMIYIGDYFGDGTKYLLQCAGYKYNTDTGEDTVECNPGTIQAVPGKLSVNTTWGKNGGAITLDPAETYLRTKYTTQKNLVLSVIRPLNVITDSQYPLTDSAKSRMQYPRLAINRTANASRFKDIEAGGTLTLSIALSNYSEQPYTVPVTEVIPGGVTLQKVSDNGQVQGKNISWSVQLPAGGSKTLTVDYTVTAKRGETITLGGGKVASIPSNTLRIPVGGKHLTTEENAKLAALAEGTYKDVPQNINSSEFAQRIYRDVLQLDVTLPSPTTIVKEVLKQTTVAGSTVYLPREDLQNELLTYKNMLVYDLAGGFYWGEMDVQRRVLDLRCDYLRPGDVLVKLQDASTPATDKTLVYAGNQKFLQYDKKSVGVTDFFALQEAHIYQLFYVLRPTMAYDDIQTRSTVVAHKQPTVTVESAAGRAGHTADVKINIADNPGITGAQLTLSYDPALTLKDIAAGEALQGLTFTMPGDLTANPITLRWNGIDADTTNGTALTL
ncbi:MAG: cohesin domain-containing protein, partial [Oscillospiraceae bacterium]|nr:cohesin domain-containing protein [Oscillospiraceae bacterium]